MRIIVRSSVALFAETLAAIALTSTTSNNNDGYRICHQHTVRRMGRGLVCNRKSNHGSCDRYLAHHNLLVVSTNPTCCFLPKPCVPRSSLSVSRRNQTTSRGDLQVEYCRKAPSQIAQGGEGKNQKSQCYSKQSWFLRLEGSNGHRPSH